MPRRKVPAKPPGVTDVLAASANDLLDKLSPRHGDWDTNPEGWVFRGQANADWKLKALAIRDPEAFRKFGLQVPRIAAGTALMWTERRRLHDELLELFRAGLDRAGLTVPTDLPPVSQEHIRQRGVRVTLLSEPPVDSLPVVALARHHGLPTVLLDWSRRAWVAAYFAAADALDPDRAEELQPRRRQLRHHLAKATHLAVWALEKLEPFGPERPLFYEAPRATNPNMSAQAGLFTQLLPLGSVSEEVAKLLPNDGIGLVEDGLAECLAGVEKLLAKLNRKRPALRRYLLRIDAAQELLRLLALEGITAQTMFPGTDGVVKAMRERALWTKPTPNMSFADFERIFRLNAAGKRTSRT